MKAMMTTSVTGNSIIYRAITLIELLFVIIIIGILIGISIPNFRKTFNSLQLNNVSRELLAFMNYLSQRSIVEEKVIFLNIDSENKEYWAQVKEDEKRLKSYRIPNEIEVEAKQDKIAFYPDGNIDNVEIKLVNIDKQSLTLTTKGVFSGVKLQTQE